MSSDLLGDRLARRDLERRAHVVLHDLAAVLDLGKLALVAQDELHVLVRVLQGWDPVNIICGVGSGSICRFSSFPFASAAGPVRTQSRTLTLHSSGGR